MDVSASGMNSEKLRMEVISHNIANIETTNQNGEPFRPKKVIFQEVLQSQINANNPIALTGAGVRVSAIVADDSPPIMVYDPHHPHANQDGFVVKADINLANQIVDSITASRAYGANVTVFNAAKSMALKALTVGRG